MATVKLWTDEGVSADPRVRAERTDLFTSPFAFGKAWAYSAAYSFFASAITGRLESACSHSAKKMS